MKEYYIIFIEVDTDKLNDFTGRHLVAVVEKLKDACKIAGEALLYKVTDTAAMLRFRNELRKWDK